MMNLYCKIFTGILGCCIGGKTNYGIPPEKTDLSSLYTFNWMDCSSSLSGQQVSADTNALPDWVFASQKDYSVGISDPISDREKAREQAIVRAICSWGLASGEKTSSVLQESMENNTNIMQGSWRLIIKSFDYKLLREFEYKTGEICVAIQVRKTEDGNKRMLVENYWSQKISENAEKIEEHLNIAVSGFKKLEVIQFKLESEGGKTTMHSSIDGQKVVFTPPFSYPEMPLSSERTIDLENIAFTPEVRYNISRLSDYPLSFSWLKTALIEAPIEPMNSQTESNQQFDKEGNEISVTSHHQADFHIPYIITAACIKDNQLIIKWEINEELNEELKKQSENLYQ